MDAMSPAIIMVIAAAVVITGTSEAHPPSAPSLQLQTDPALVAYTALVTHVELDTPIDRRPQREVT